MKAQYGILRFKKYKGPAISPIETHNERTKEQYASNPDIDTNRSRYNFHLVQPQGKYREEADRMIAASNCRVRKGLKIYPWTRKHPTCTFALCR